MLNMARAIALGTSGPLVGWLLDRTGAVVFIVIGAAVTGFALLLASRGATFTALFTAYLMIGAGIGFCARMWLPNRVRRTARPRSGNFRQRQFHFSGCR
jgi:MFS family permease